MKIVASLGNKNIFKLSKTAFLCSREIPASVVLKCYDWAIEQREQENCVISGFHSKIEKDVLHYLLKGTQPIIIALARGIKQKIEPEFKKPLADGRILIITPFDKNVTKVTEETAYKRNELMLKIADKIVIGYIRRNGLLEKLILTVKNKTVHKLYG